MIASRNRQTSSARCNLSSLLHSALTIILAPQGPVHTHVVQLHLAYVYIVRCTTAFGIHLANDYTSIAASPHNGCVNMFVQNNSPLYYINIHCTTTIVSNALYISCTAWVWTGPNRMACEVIMWVNKHNFSLHGSVPNGTLLPMYSKVMHYVGNRVPFGTQPILLPAMVLWCILRQVELVCETPNP